MIEETVGDISYFITILAVFLCCFANCIYLLNNYRIQIGDTAEIFDQPFDNNVLNAVINQYLLALGEFGTDNLSMGEDGKLLPNAYLCWLLFIGATFIT